ncbi:MAG TPA: MarR family transcriptional regulator [Oligoflexus sp.]|uniref:MarR family winged helix-turn-helix transcriptional regulator n=1 Tax=Oligoflexus sp. TaxID=1971216 RepID=UPI002D64F17A|nr:MarR family transcriptional regulator [Oligoflexus sp.]HYX33703.1 MarR family transcriptional regulator [Oligoflexus sp.]
MTEDIVRRLGYLTLGTRLRRLGERIQADTQRILDDHELAIPSAQFPFLAAIDRLGPQTIGDLARAVGVTQPGATRTILQLEESKLVLVVPSDEDQRRKVVSLTAKGKDLVMVGKRAAWPAIEHAVRDLCHKLNGPLLDQLTAIEDGLIDQPLRHRAKLKKEPNT